MSESGERALSPLQLMLEKKKREGQQSVANKSTHKQSKQSKQAKQLKHSKQSKHSKESMSTARKPRLQSKNSKLQHEKKKPTQPVQRRRSAKGPTPVEQTLPAEPTQENLQSMDIDISPESMPCIQMDTMTSASNHLIQRYSSLEQKQQMIVQMAQKLGGVESTEDVTDSLISDVVSNIVQPSAMHNTEAEVMQSIQKMSNLLLRTPHNHIQSLGPADVVALRSNTTVVRRQWEEKFLHEPSGCERACCNRSSNSCFASFIENNGIVDPNFALCEFYTEMEYTEIEKKGWQWPEDLRPCLLCLRNMIFFQFLQTRCNSASALPSVNYAPIGNLVSVHGEYCAENCFLSKPEKFEGLLTPVVIPHVLDYRVSTINGIRHLQQLLPYPGQFRSNFFF